MLPKTESEATTPFRRTTKIAQNADICNMAFTDVISKTTSLLSEISPVSADMSTPVPSFMIEDSQCATYIMNYLHNHNCLETERIFIKELEKLGKPVPKFLNDQSEGSKAFDALVGFIETFKAKNDANDCFVELSQVLYPCLVYLYLNLIRSSKSEEANSLFENYSHFIGRSELASLQVIYDQVHIKSIYPFNIFNEGLETDVSKCPIYQRQLHYVVQLSSAAYRVLKNWVVGCKQKILFPCFQEWIHFDVIDHADESFDVISSYRPSTEVYMYSGGWMGEPLIDLNRSKVYYGLLKNGSKKSTETPDDIDSPQRKSLRKSAPNRAKNESIAPPMSRRIPLPTLFISKNVSNPCNVMHTLAEESKEYPPSVCLYTITQSHSEAVCAKFSENILAVGFYDGSICLWALAEEKPLKLLKCADDLEELDPCIPSIGDAIFDNDTERQCFTLAGHSSAVHCLDFSSCGGLLLSGSSDFTVRLWSTFTMSCLVVYKGHTQGILGLKFSPYDHYFATASRDKSARLWVQDQINCVRIFSNEDHYGDVLCVDFHPNCHYLATGGEDRYVRLFDLAASQQSGIMHRSCVRTYSGHKAAVEELKFTECGRYLISVGGQDGLVCIFDISWTSSATCAPAYIVNILDCSGISSLLSISPDSNFIAVGGDTEGSVRIWNLLNAINNENTKDNPQNFLVSSQFTKSTTVLNLNYVSSSLVLAVGRLDNEDSEESQQ